MNKIYYVKGDVLDLEHADRSKNVIIPHICNNIGGWGRGFVVALSNKWKAPEAEYRLWAAGKHAEYPKFELGQIQVVEVERDLFVANMVAQHGVQWIGDIPPIRYDRVRQCLLKLATIANKIDPNTTIHMPRMGAGLAGGTWQVIEGLIKETLIAKGFDVYVYDLEE